MKEEKFLKQAAQYEFPYHYIAYSDTKGKFYRIRKAVYGFEYLTYMKNIVEKLKKYNIKNILDVGCGDGRLLSLLDRKNFTMISGYDLVEQAIQFAKAFNMESDCVCEDIEKIQVKYDAITCIEVLEHIPDEEITNFLNKIFSKLKRNGVLLIQVPTKVQALTLKHYRHYDIKLLEEQLKKVKYDINILEKEYVFYDTFLSKVYQRVSCNKYFIFAVDKIEQLFWRYCWNKLRFATEKNGKHLLVVVEKL